MYWAFRGQKWCDVRVPLAYQERVGREKFSVCVYSALTDSHLFCPDGLISFYFCMSFKHIIVCTFLATF